MIKYTYEQRLVSQIVEGENGQETQGVLLSNAKDIVSNTVSFQFTIGRNIIHISADG